MTSPDVTALAAALAGPWPSALGPRGYDDPHWQEALAEAIIAALAAQHVYLVGVETLTEALKATDPDVMPEERAAAILEVLRG